MTVDKACGARGCAFANHRCAHSWVARFQEAKQRYVIRVDDYAVLRDGPAHVASKGDAERWTEAMIEVARKGGDPRLPPPAPVVVVVDTMKALLEDYAVARLPKLRQKASPRSELKHLRAFFSDADPATLLQEETRVAEYVLALQAGWKADPEAAPGKGRGVITVNRLLTRWRNVVEWAKGQQPPRLARSPFHAYGTVIKTSEEEPRTRRLQDGEWDALVAALSTLDDKQHRFRADVMERLLLGVRHAALRLTEATRVRETDIDWTACTITLRKGKQKRKELDARHIPFERGGALHTALLTRRFLKAPANFVFGQDDGTALTANKTATANFRRAWVTLNLTAHGYLPAPEDVSVNARYKAEATRTIALTLRDLRRECASQWWEAKVDIRTIQLLLGHSTSKTTERYLQLRDTDALSGRLGEALGWKMSQTRPDCTTNAPQSGATDTGLKLAKGGK